MAALVWGNQNPFHRSLELFGLITTPYIKRLFGSLRIIPCYCLGNLVQQKPNSPWWVWFPLKANLGTGEEHASRIQGGNNLRHPPPFSQRPSPQSWLKPPKGHFKINVDGAFANDGSHSCIGVIIRDDKGHPVTALSKILQSHYSAKVTEMLALE